MYFLIMQICSYVLIVVFCLFDVNLHLSVFTTTIFFDSYKFIKFYFLFYVYKFRLFKAFLFLPNDFNERHNSVTFYAIYLQLLVTKFKLNNVYTSLHFIIFFEENFLYIFLLKFCVVFLT